MAHRIRRKSMEHLDLYDLDDIIIPVLNNDIPPPLPPPRIRPRRVHQNGNSKRYEFLCDITRIKNDPIYAATPMFTTIPQSSNVKYPRQVLGSYIPPEIITPKTPTSAEPKSADADDDTEDKEEEKEEESSDDDDNQRPDDSDKNDDDDDDDNNKNQSSSSSSNEDNDNDIISDDDDDDDDDYEHEKHEEKTPDEDKKK